MAFAEAPVDQVREGRAEDSAENVGVLLKAGPAEDVLARLGEADQLVLVLSVEGGH